MRRYVLHLLAAVNIALAVALTSLWLDRQGHLRNTTWAPPLAVKADLGKLPAQVAQASDADISRFVAILDRPLFSPSRRPPPPPPPPAPAPPPDPFADFELFGLFSGQAGSGVMARVGGKVRRVSLNDQVSGWILKEIDDRNVTFTNGEQTRVFKLVARKVAAPPKQASASSPAGGVNAGSAPTNSYNDQLKQQLEEQTRERFRLLNQARAKAGLPPFPQ